MLRELFDITLKSKFATTSRDLQSAIEIYERSDSRQRNYESIRTKVLQGGQILRRDDIRRKLEELLKK